MKKTLNHLKALTQIGVLAGSLILASSASAAPLINLPFNEGSGMTTIDTASGLTGVLGAYHDPLVDYVELTPNSPSGLTGDNAITTFGKGFLVAYDTNSVLAITNGPITIESWVYIPPVGANTPGIVGYGSTYKMGLRGGYQVFTLFGLKDITNGTSAIDTIIDSQWVHLAAAWDPGVGVNFYVNGVHNFVEYTNSSTARSPLTNFLSIGAETLANNWVGSLDRVRIHHALLDASQLDTDPATPKPPIPGVTLLAYNFDEAAFPSTNLAETPLPTAQAYTVFPTNSTLWTNDSPTGLPEDFALNFPADETTKPQVAVEYGGTTIDLGQNNTNYTLQVWVKVPADDAFEDRRVIYRTSGTPGPRVALSLHPLNGNRTLHTTIFGAADFATTVPYPNDGRWHHIAMVMTNFSQLQFHLDGVLRQTVTRTATQTNVTSGGVNALYVGGESNTRYFHGVLDRVIIHSDALTVPELDYPAIPGLATFPTLASHPASIVTNLGSDVVFSAAPSSPSAATYQWVYRTNLADTVAVPLPGQTATTLNLSDISAADEGFYSLVVSNSVGVSESYSAQLSLPVDLSPKLIGFEEPNYAPGFLELQDGWTTDVNFGGVRVLTGSEIEAHLEATERTPGQTTHDGSQAVLFTGPGLAMNSFRSFTGLESENNVTVSLWFRALNPGNTGAPTGNVFLRVQNAAGVNAAGFRVGPNFSIDYGLVANAWVPTGIIADTNTWYQITIQLDYSTKTYDFFVDGVKVNSNPIPFYHSTANPPVSHTSTSFNRLNLFKGANQAGLILDDLNVAGPAIAPSLGIRQQDGNLVLFWPTSVTGYVLEGSDNLTSPNWETVTHSVNGNENQATVQATGTKFYRLKK